MTITDKTRKLLWGHSGNRCVICGQELTFSATSTDNVAIVGDECHIISGEANGPRYDASYAVGRIDSYENLILLCRVHHKMVDDQSNTYTAEVLRQKKGITKPPLNRGCRRSKGPSPLRFEESRRTHQIFSSELPQGSSSLT